MRRIKTLLLAALMALASEGLTARGLMGAAPASSTRSSIQDFQALPPQPDSADLRKRAESAQARYERTRRRLMPWVRAQGSRPCEEHVGRLCLWHGDDDDWVQPPDRAELVAAREDLLVTLAQVGMSVPGDGWVLGQRVHYLGEAGEWRRGAALARACGPAEAWWCDALEGFALHGAGDYDRAMDAFRRAFSGMDAEQAREWRDPALILDDKGDDVLDDASDEEWETILARVWRLADPLYLVPGNDRETEHYARWTLARVRDRARTAWGMPWGKDLDELTVRYGWERGWERRRPLLGSVSSFEATVSHEQPDGREFVPPGDVLERSADTEPGAWIPEEERPRSSHTPAYAPWILPGIAQVAVFHRGDSVVVAAATRLPEKPEDPRGWAVTETPNIGGSGAREGLFSWPRPALLAEPPQVGLFLLDTLGEISEKRHVGASARALTLTVPAGGYLISVEAWEPGEGRAGRIRHGIATDTVPENLATLSNLIIMDPTDSLPTDLVSALPLMRPSTDLLSGESIAVGWELFGLGWRPEDIEFEISLYEDGEGFFGKVGRWFGLGGRKQPLRISWQEPGPSHAGPWFRSVGVELPDVDPGRYILRLAVSLRGRGVLIGTRPVEISR